MNLKKEKTRENHSKNGEKHAKNWKHFDTFGKRHPTECNYRIWRKVL